MESFFGSPDKKEFTNVAMRSRKTDYGIVLNIAIQSRKDLIDLADRLDTPKIKQLGYAKVAKVEFDSLNSTRNPTGFF